MSHNHKHNHFSNSNIIRNNKLLFATILNFTITIIEVAGGMLSNSVALLSDALHNFGDGVGIFMVFLANKVSKRKATKERTYGFKRIEILTAIFNGILLIAICIYLIFKAYKRFINPEPIDGAIMVIVATIGLIANFLAMALLKSDADKNINIKAAYLHLLADSLSSIAVLVGGILIYFYRLYWFDPIITFIISLYIFKETWFIIREAYLIIMQATPRNLDLVEVKKRLETIDEIDNVHHVHAWNLDDTQIHFECHIDLKRDCNISETEPLIHKIKDFLHDEFNIAHTTIQFEYNCCNNKSMIY